MRFSSLLAVSGLMLASTVGLAVAGDHTSFSGTWMLDNKASSGNAPAWSSMTVAEKGHWFRMAQNDKDGRVIRAIEGECKTDNRFHPVEGGDGGSISCKWEGPTLVTRQHWNNDQNERSVRTTLEPSGKLIQDIHETDASGTHDAHLVWFRQ